MEFGDVGEELELGFVLHELLRCPILECAVDSGREREDQVKQHDIVSTLLVS